MDRQALHVIQPLMNKQVTELGLHLAGPSSEAAAGGRRCGAGALQGVKALQ